jgi:hypothetical protein
LVDAFGLTPQMISAPIALDTPAESLSEPATKRTQASLAVH